MLALCMGAFVASCSSDEPASRGAEIAFSVEAAKQPARSGEALATDFNMWITALYHGEDGNSHRFFFAAPYEKNFVWSEASQCWKNNGEDLFYPVSGDMDFVAYACANTQTKPAVTYAPAAFDNTHSTFETYTLDFGNTLGGTSPVVVSDLKSVACGSGTGLQTLQFRHATAKVSFMAVSDDVTGGHFRITYLKILDAKPSGVCDVTVHPTTGAVGSSLTVGSQAAWRHPLGGSATTLTAGSSECIATTTSQAYGTALYLPPQDGDVTLELGYRIHNSSTGSAVQATPEYSTTFTLPASEWVVGYHYIYTINCNLTEITVSQTSTGAIIDNWTSVTVNSDEYYTGRSYSSIANP